MAAPLFAADDEPDLPNIEALRLSYMLASEEPAFEIAAALVICIAGILHIQNNRANNRTRNLAFGVRKYIDFAEIVSTIFTSANSLVPHIFFYEATLHLTEMHGNDLAYHSRVENRFDKKSILTTNNKGSSFARK